MGRARAVLERSGPVPLLVALFWLLVLPVLLGGDDRSTAGGRDERNFHLPTVLELAEELPSPDLENVQTATSPGFHLVLSVFGRLVSDDRELLELVGALFSLAMVLVAYRLLARSVDRWLAFGLTLPLLLSHYVLQSAAWLNTDNAALLFILLVLGVALEPPATAGAFARGGLYLFLAVWARQLALWAAGPFVVAAALTGRLRDRRPLLLAGLAVLPALAVIGFLAIAWGGYLTPPGFREQSGLSPAALPFTLAIVGFFGWFFAACAVRRADLLAGRAPLLAAAGGALLAAAAPTTETTGLQKRTGGGVWKAVDAAPSVADRSLVILLLAAAGGAVLVGLWRAAARRAMGNPALVVLVAMGSLAVAQVATVRSYQRYFEPALLVMLALLAAFAGPERDRLIRAMAWLVAVQAAGVITVVYDRAL
jgi:hypothetical protein